MLFFQVTVIALGPVSGRRCCVINGILTHLLLEHVKYRASASVQQPRLCLLHRPWKLGQNVYSCTGWEGVLGGIVPTPQSGLLMTSQSILIMPPEGPQWNRGGKREHKSIYSPMGT